jgi:Rha family phage regulatory protein
MTLHHDLFPETLVVTLMDGQPMTSSLEIAAHFGKPHDAVLKAIRKTIKRAKNPERLVNFYESFTTYTTANGAQRKRPIYYLTKDGFNFTVMGFTGEKADEWKWRFIDAFNALEAELKTKTERYATALDQVRPCLRPVVEGTESGHDRATIAAPLGRSVRSISYHRRRARDLGLLPENAA